MRLTTILLLFLSSNLYAQNFEVSYKNLHTLGLILCHEVTESKQLPKANLQFNQFEVEQSRYGKLAKQKVFELTGHCMKEFSVKTKKVESEGYYISFKIDMASPTQIKGEVGDYNLLINLNKGKLSPISLTHKYLGQRKKVSFKAQDWASSSLISAKKLRVAIGKNTLRENLNGTITGPNAVLKNHWSYSSLSCLSEDTKILKYCNDQILPI